MQISRDHKNFPLFASPRGGIYVEESQMFQMLYAYLWNFPLHMHPIQQQKKQKISSKFNML